MLSFTAQVSGEQIARELWQDHEELSYCLVALAREYKSEGSSTKALEEITSHMTRDSLVVLNDFLQPLLKEMDTLKP